MAVVLDDLGRVVRELGIEGRNLMVICFYIVIYFEICFKIVVFSGVRKRFIKKMVLKYFFLSFLKIENCL